MNEEALSRQAMIFGDDLYGKSLAILGVGGIGSNAAHLAASVGVARLMLIDFDTVAGVNVYPGFFNMQDIGVPKTVATAIELGTRLDVDILVEVFAEMNQLRNRDIDIVMVCTDNIESRAEMWHMCKGMDRWFIDGRMGGTECELYAFRANDEESVARYEPTLEGRFSDLPCGMKATAALTKGWLPAMLGQVFYDISIGREPEFKQQYSLGNRMYLKPGVRS